MDEKQIIQSDVVDMESYSIAKFCYINKIKYSIEGELIKPDYYFLIPELDDKSPKKLKSSSGFDVISQSLESIIAIKSNNESLRYAKMSLMYSLKYFIPFLRKQNFEKQSNLKK